MTMVQLAELAERVGFISLYSLLNFKDFRNAELPAIISIQSNFRAEFAVLAKVSKRTFHIIYANGRQEALTLKEFNELAILDSYGRCKALFLSRTNLTSSKSVNTKQGMKLSDMFVFLKDFKKAGFHLFFALLLTSFFQLAIPILTQSVVDVGILTRNVPFIYLIISAQLALVAGRLSVEFILSWVLLHISARVNISVFNEFLVKLMKLPIDYFGAGSIGSILQKTKDQQAIERFLTDSSLGAIFSIFNLFMFSIVLAYYNLTIFIVYVAFTSVYFTWLFLFIKKRKMLNIENFENSAGIQNDVIELVDGMHEIKLNNAEDYKRWQFEDLQAKQFRIHSKELSIDQAQMGGSALVNEVMNILITFFCAKAVMNGNLTFGEMIAIQFIIGQLNGPIQQSLNFIHDLQDAKLAIGRLTDVFLEKDEDENDMDFEEQLPENKTIKIDNLNFSFKHDPSKFILKKINLEIKEGQVTAIVGTSGSGKTTLLKLLLRYYPTNTHEISIGEEPLNSINIRTWRKKCGAVMQDGYIFSDTIKKNIVVEVDEIDREKLKNAIKIANLQNYLDILPLGMETLIGAEGNAISQGQRQRILIARAVYKNPEILFFDEATNALDSENERIIVDNLQKYFKGKTVIIVAHRLSTVKNADQIAVLENGIIIEQGNHSELLAKGKSYYELVRNQLKLDS